ncbi:unnamed protein product [Scytosiphon promiscuus]
MGEMERSGGQKPVRWHRSSWCVYLYVATLLAMGSVNAMTMEVEEGNDDCVFINAKEGSTINANYEILGPPVKDTMVILRQKTDDRLLYKREELAEDYIRTKATMDSDYELCFINGNKELIRMLRNKDVDKDATMIGLDAMRQEKKKALAAEKKERSKIGDDDDYMGSYSNMFPLSVGDDMLPWYGAEASTRTFGFGLRVGEDGEDLASMADVSKEDKAVANFLKEEADVLVQSLLFFNDHESYMRGREEFHRENVKETSSRLMWCTLIEAAVLVWVSWSQLSYIRRFFETKRVL